MTQHWRKQYPPRCPKHGVDMVLKRTKKFCYPNSGGPRRFWACPEWEASGCDWKCSAHPDGTPASSPASPELRMERHNTHLAMDRYMEAAGISRDMMYEELGKWLGVEDPHIGFADLDDCLLVQDMLKGSI